MGGRYILFSKLGGINSLFSFICKKIHCFFSVFVRACVNEDLTFFKIGPPGTDMGNKRKKQKQKFAKRRTFFFLCVCAVCE